MAAENGGMKLQYVGLEDVGNETDQLEAKLTCLCKEFAAVLYQLLSLEQQSGQTATKRL